MGTLSTTAISIRGLPADIKSRLRVKAAQNGRSMEAEARAILEDALAPRAKTGQDVVELAARLFKPFGVDQLEEPSPEFEPGSPPPYRARTLD